MIYIPLSFWLDPKERKTQGCGNLARNRTQRSGRAPKLANAVTGRIFRQLSSDKGYFPSTFA
jgi:hypothetical protein